MNTCTRCKGTGSEPESREPLTDRQRDIYDAIKRYHGHFGVTPTYTTLASIVGLRSLASVHDHIHALARKRWIKVRRGGWRQSIRLLGE